MNNITLKKTLKKILENRKKNMLEGSDILSWLFIRLEIMKDIYVKKELKNSQRIFLTYEFGENFDFIDKGDSTPLNLIDQQKGPIIISEEFLSYTGHGASARFCFFRKQEAQLLLKLREYVQVMTAIIPLPGFSDDCSANAGDSCGDTMLGLTRFD